MNSIDFRFTVGQALSIPGLSDNLVNLSFLPRIGRFSDASLFKTQVRLSAVCDDPVPLAGKFAFACDGASATLREGAHFSPQAIEDALNSISTIRTAGLVDVQYMGPGIYDVRFRENGAQEAITVSEASFGALSRVTQIQTGDGSARSIQRINLQVGKLAEVANASFSSIAAGAVSVSTYSTGDASAPQGEEITFGDRIPEGGTMTVSIDGGVIYSDPINCPPNAYEIQKALDSLDHGDFIVTRTPGAILVTRRYNGSNTAIQVDDDGIRWPEGKSCELDWADCLRILERHHPKDRANVSLRLETSDDFTDSGEDVVTMLTVDFQVALTGERAASVGVV